MRLGHPRRQQTGSRSCVLRPDRPTRAIACSMLQKARPSKKCAIERDAPCRDRRSACPASSCASTAHRAERSRTVKDCDEDKADHKASSRLPLLRGLAVDSDGTVHAAATSCHCTIKITPDGQVGMVLKAERPWSPTGVAIHGPDVYVLEFSNANGPATEGWRPRVRKLGRDGKVATLATISDEKKRSPQKEWLTAPDKTPWRACSSIPL
jgi:hypothetical protein